MHIRDEAQVAVYSDLWERLAATALTGDDARKLLADYAAQLGAA